MKKAVVFNVDDFCDNEWGLMDCFEAMKARYPKFKVTLFTISFKISHEHLVTMAEAGWIETAVHGFNHIPNKDMRGEMLTLSKEKVLEGFSKLDFSLFTRGFRAPYWLMSEETIECCNQFGMWVAIHHTKNPVEWRSLAKHGYYYPRNTNAFECWYGHTYDIRRELPGLLEKWPVDQEFAFVSEAVQMETKLNLGAGINPRKGFINLDINPDLPARFPDYDMRIWNIRDGLVDVLNLPEIEAESVDAITESHTLMYLRVEEYEKFFRDVFWVLRKGGVFRITEDDCENPDCGKYGLPWHGEELKESGPPSITGPKMMRAELEKVGFEVHDMLKWGETLWIDNSLQQNHHGGIPRVFYMEAVKW